MDALERFLQKAETIQASYDKYRDAAIVLGKALNETSNTLSVISQRKYVLSYTASPVIIA